MPATGAVGHVPVLMRAVLEVLSPRAGQTAVDCTVGRGGHALELAQRLGPTGRLIALDVDPGNLAFAQARLAGVSCAVKFVHASFAALPSVLEELGVAKVDLLLADLGFASNQMDDPARGLSFAGDGPLDMRLDPTRPGTAADLVNQLPERELADLIYQYGEERLSRRIARKIVEARRQSPMRTTTDLARIVRSAVGGPRHQRLDPATRTFMALRIAVNGELDALDALLGHLPRVLAPGGAAAIISFHSLEDRRVKQALVGFKQAGRAEVLTKKPITADDEEILANPRSRSAKLRGMRWRDA